MSTVRSNHATSKIDQAEKDGRRDQLTSDHKRTGRNRARRNCGDCEEIQRNQQSCNGKNPATRCRQFPAVLRVETNAKQHGCDCRKDQKLQDGNTRYLSPQANHQGRGAPYDQQSADYFSPANVALFHESVEHLAERLSWWAWR